MPSYRFTTIDDSGRILRDQREASNVSLLSATLRREGRWLAEVRETSDWRPHPKRFRSADRRVSATALEQFFLSLSLQLNAGVNLVAALGFGLQADAPSSFRHVHSDLLARVKAGMSLSEAMASHPRAFSPVVVNLVRAGEASGRLGEVCEEVRTYYEWNERIRGDIKQAMIYPITLFLAAGSFFVVVFTFFIPRFTGVLKELGVPLPLLTRVMIQVSEFVLDHYILVPASILLPPLLVAFACRISSSFARRVDAFKLRIPFVGIILWQSYLCRLTHNLSSLYRAGIPLLEALKLCEPIVCNREIQAGVRVVREGVAAGRPLHETMTLSAIFPPMVVQLTALGETTGTLDQSLQNAAKYYDVVVPRAVKKLFTLFEPVMILALLVVVGTIVLSVFLPIASALGAK